jgi:hypothetical protein
MEHIGKYLPFVGPDTKTKKVPIARNPLFYWCGGKRKKFELRITD